MNLIEGDEQLYELDETLVSMTEESLLFWLPKFIAEVHKGDGGLYPPNNVYQNYMLWAVTSDVLNCNKKKKFDESMLDSDSKQDQVISRESENKPIVPEGQFSNLPVLNLGGATNFTINFNLGKDSCAY